MLKAGLSYRQPMAVWIDGNPRLADFLEIPAEVFVRPEMANRLAMLSRAYPLSIRSTSLSLATPGAIPEDLLRPLADIATAVGALWVSEPVGFRRTGETTLKIHCPAVPNDDSIAIIAEHTKEVSGRSGCPVLIETMSSPLRFGDPLDEPDFLNRLCERSGCRLLLDLTALCIDARRHGFVAARWLSGLDPAAIAMLRLSGDTARDGRPTGGESAAIPAETWDLARQAISRSPDAGALMEHDLHIPAVDALESELATIRTLAGAA